MNFTKAPPRIPKAKIRPLQKSSSGIKEFSSIIIFVIPILMFIGGGIFVISTTTPQPLKTFSPDPMPTPEYIQIGNE